MSVIQRFTVGRGYRSVLLFPHTPEGRAARFAHYEERRLVELAASLYDSNDVRAGRLTAAERTFAWYFGDSLSLSLRLASGLSTLVPHSYPRQVPTTYTSRARATTATPRRSTPRGNAADITWLDQTDAGFDGSDVLRAPLRDHASGTSH